MAGARYFHAGERAVLPPQMAYGQNLLAQALAGPTNTIGGGIQSAGQSIAGALLTKAGIKAQKEQERLAREQARATASSLADLILPLGAEVPTTAGGPNAGAAQPPGGPSVPPGVDPRMAQLAALLRSPEGPAFSGQIGGSLVEALVGQAFQQPAGPSSALGKLEDDYRRGFISKQVYEARLAQIRGDGGKTTPYSDLGKLQADRAAGLINDAQYQAEVARLQREDNGLTQPQMAQNSEIDNARQALAELQRSLPAGTSLSDELNRRMSQYDPLTGLETPDYNSYWGRLGWLAMQSKVGGDPDVNRWTQRLMPIAQTPAQVALEDLQAPPTDEGGGFFESLFGRSGATAAPPPGPMRGNRATVAPLSSPGPLSPRPAGTPTQGNLGPSGRTGAQIESMSLKDLDALVNTRGDSLSPAELQRIAARLDALERGSPRSLPR